MIVYLSGDERYICEYDVLTTFGYSPEEALDKMNGLMKILCEYDKKQYNKFYRELLEQCNKLLGD